MVPDDPDRRTHAKPSDSQSEPGLDATRSEVRGMPDLSSVDSDERTHAHRGAPPPVPAPHDATRSQGGPSIALSSSILGSTDRSAPVSTVGMIRSLTKRFELIGQLGEGGMGMVFKARDPESKREIALKVVHAAKMTPKRLERFRREGEVTAALSHPGIIKVHSAGEVDGIPYLAYELVLGCTTLDQAAKELGTRERVALVREVAEALGHAHAHGVVHRDVKPDNILIDADGLARVADFGLATVEGLERLTRTGAMVGTPYFMAPELFEGRRDEVGPATDVWALGVILYQLLTDELPFDAGTIKGLGDAILRATPTPPRSHDTAIPTALEAVILKALTREPHGRYRDGAGMAEDLTRWLEGRPVLAAKWRRLRGTWRRGRSWIVVGAVVALLAAGIVLALPSDPVVEVDETPPVLEPAGLLAGEEHEVWQRRIVVSGVVRDSGPWVRVRVGKRLLRVLPDEPFELEVPLEVGENHVRVELSDAAGNDAQPRTLIVIRHPAPEWLEALKGDERPVLPLPDQVSFGKRAGEYVNEHDGSILVWIPPGQFMMGAATDDAAAEDDERPAHQVTIQNGFYLGKYELTWDKYLRFCRARKHGQPPWPQSTVPRAELIKRHPVVHVTWEDASAYCRWAKLRLPTEAEWEWAARGPQGRRYPWGQELPERRGYCNRMGGDLYSFTSPIGSFPRRGSPFDCLDMAGNVWEWVSDRYALYTPEARTDPTGPESPGTVRVHRGGAWNSLPVTCRTTTRQQGAEDYTSFAVGMRVARSAH